MMLIYPDIQTELMTEPRNKIQTIVMENIPFFRTFVSDMTEQANGMPGKAVLSKLNKPIDMAKNAEVITDFLSFSLNTKSLISKINYALEQAALAPEFLYRKHELLSSIETFIEDISFGFSCDLECAKLDMGSVIKSAGVEICDSYADKLERLVDYMELVREFDHDKLFITVNMRAFFTDEETIRFMDTVCRHGYEVIMVESFCHAKLPYERRLTIDNDLCEF